MTKINTGITKYTKFPWAVLENISTSFQESL